MTLPNGQSFLARYERVSKKVLPRNVTIARTQQIGKRRQRKCKIQQRGSLLGNIAKLGPRALTTTGLWKKGLGVGTRALNSGFGKKPVDEGIKHAPELYKFGASKTKNKALGSDFASYAVQEAQKKAVENLFG